MIEFSAKANVIFWDTPTIQKDTYVKVIKLI